MTEKMQADVPSRQLPRIVRYCLKHIPYYFTTFPTKKQGDFKRFFEKNHAAGKIPAA